MAEDQIEKAPPPGVGDEQAATQASQDRIDRIISRHGGDPAQLSSPEPTPAPSSGGSAPAGEEERATGKSAAEIHPNFLERVSRNQRLKQLEKRNALLERMIQDAIDGAPGEGPAEPASAKPAPQAPADVPDFDADPRGWYEHQNRQLESALLEKFSPVLEFVGSLREREQQAAEARHRDEQRSRVMAERRDLMQIAEAEYTAKPEAEGYYDRLGEFGTTLVDYYRQLGHPERTGPNGIHSAADMAGLHLHGMVTMALQYGFNPAEYVDRAMRAQGFTGASRETQEPAAAPRARANRSETEAMAAAAKSGLASSLSQGGAGRAPAAGIAGLKNKSDVSVADLKAALAKMPPGTQRQRLAALREQIRKTG